MKQKVEANIDYAIWSMRQATNQLEKAKDANPVGVDHYIGSAKIYVQQAHIYVDNAEEWNKDILTVKEQP